ncbi:MAG: hypothetical protein KIT69_06885 [Propionibacteriaceae bacterium]|nr:hypothetical protein [Propionibacteriaceae bacterium]
MAVDPKKRCTARSKQTGEQCGNTRVPGAMVCRFHGAGALQVKSKAAERVAEQQAQAAARQLAIPIDTTPEQALLDEVKRAAGMVAFYQARIVEIDQQERGALIWGITKEKLGGDDEGQTSEAAPNVWLKLFNEERDRLVRVAAAAIKAGIEERRVKLAESQGEMVAMVLRRVLDQMLTTVLGVAPAASETITTAWAETVNEVVPRELRALSTV